MEGEPALVTSDMIATMRSDSERVKRARVNLAEARENFHAAAKGRTVAAVVMREASRSMQEASRRFLNANAELTRAIEEAETVSRLVLPVIGEGEGHDSILPEV